MFECCSLLPCFFFCCVDILLIRLFCIPFPNDRRANEEVPFCYGVALEDRDYCSIFTSTSPAASVRGTASVMAATIVAIGAAIMFA